MTSIRIKGVDQQRLWSTLIPVIAVLLAFYVLVYELLYQQTADKYASELKQQAQKTSALVNRRLSADFYEIHTDLFILKNVFAEYADNPTKESLRRTNQTATMFSAHKKRYDQIRFLDNTGQEVVRINYNNGAPSVIAKEKLQNKAHRYYFTESYSLKNNQIYASPFDLNMENKAVEVPLKPMIRFATPVFNTEGKKQGVVILNYLGQFLINDIKRGIRGFDGNTLLINPLGYYLMSADNALNWNFMFPEAVQIRFQDQFPYIWQAIPKNGFSHMKTAKGVFSISQLAIEDSAFTENACQSCKLTLILHTPKQRYEKALDRQFNQIVWYFWVAVLVISIIVILVVWLREIKLCAMQQLDNAHQDILAERDLFVGGPTIIIKWRNQFGWPIDYISTNVEQLLGHPKVRFTNGELSFSSIIAPEFLHQVSEESIRAQKHKELWFEHSPYQIVAADGNRIWVQDTTTVIRDTQGNISHFFAYINNITPLKKAEEELSKSHRHMQTVIDTIADPTLVIDIKTHKLIIANQSAREAYSSEAVMSPNMTCHLLSHKRDTPCTGANDPCPIETIKQTKASTKVLHKHFSKDGDVIYAEVHATPIFDETGENVVQIIESHHDVTQRVEMEEQLKHLAVTDGLTQISNRMEFDRELAEQIELAHEIKSPLGLIMFDLDHFKRVNDTYGHDVGDLVLKEMVKRIKQHTRKSDQLARWGGEEFMMITPMTSVQVVHRIAEELRRRISDSEFEQVGTVTVSIGAAVLKPDESMAEFVKRVDEALYRSKQSGRNRTTIAD